MKKITIIFMSVLMIFASCSMDTSYDDTNYTKEKTNTEIVKEPKEDDSENNAEEPSNKDDSENEIEDESSKEENNSENNDVATKPTENNNDEPSNEEPKEDDSENNTEEPSNEDDSKSEIVENKTWCYISEDTLILGLNYFVCIDNSQTKLKPSINVESKAKTGTFLVRGYASKYVEIRVRYDNEKLNFSSVNDTYTITNVAMEDSNVNITIEWK